MNRINQHSLVLAILLGALAGFSTQVEAQSSVPTPTGGGSANPMRTLGSGDSYVMPEVASRYGSLPGSFFFHTWLAVGQGSPRLAAPRSFAIAAREPRALRPSSTR
jgi:hypothetical protein